MTSNRRSQRVTRGYAASKTLKRSLMFFMFAAAALCVAGVAVSGLFTEDVVIRAEATAREQLDRLWKSYQHYYIRNGRVNRPKNDFDTVSEGQAYAMIRAVWQNDRAAFDAVYLWTEEHLSRLATHGDNLLSWRYGLDKIGSETILDANAAIDADLDYALALFIAARKWPDGRAPGGLPPYREKALAVADDIMAKAVRPIANGELVLLPWPTGDTIGDDREYVLNPSYFSPGHYRVFDLETGNRRWSKLASDTYRQLARLLAARAGQVVAAPDWIVIRPDGSFAEDPARGYVSGWDAFRLWWRIRIDFDLTGNPRVPDLVTKQLEPFLIKSMDESGGEVATESERDGTPRVKRSNPGMTAVYGWATRDISPATSRSLQRQALRRLQQDGDFLYFHDREDYYTNSWAWLAMTEGSTRFPFAELFNVRNGAFPEEQP